MTIIYPINGKNERMGSLFKVPKHLLLYKGQELVKISVRVLQKSFDGAKVIILTNTDYEVKLRELFIDNQDVDVKIIAKTSSQVETLRKGTVGIDGPVLFVDCDIVPEIISDFDREYTTVFTFENKEKLLNYSNFKINKSKYILDCNEKQKFYKNAGAGIYYFANVDQFNTYSEGCRSVSECIKKVLIAGEKAKANTDSTIKRFGTLQDIYIDNFSFREGKVKDLSTGFTSNKVFKEGQTVIKEGTTTLAEKEWYEAYKNKKHIPAIITYENNKLVLKYIKRDADINLDDILDLLEEYRHYEKLNNLTFKSYIGNIQTHLDSNKAITNGAVLLKHLSQLNIKSTFCHGDLSVMNIIPTKKGLKLIDPLYSEVKFGSYELDIAKLCFSFRYYKNDSASFHYIAEKTDLGYLNILVAAEAVRVATYKKEYSFIAENLINELEINFKNTTL